MFLMSLVDVSVQGELHQLCIPVPFAEAESNLSLNELINFRVRQKQILRRRREKSSLVLTAIIVVFLCSQSIR